MLHSFPYKIFFISMGILVMKELRECHDQFIIKRNAYEQTKAFLSQPIPPFLWIL